MILVAECTEGENSEPNYTKALKDVYFGTSAITNTNLEIIPIPLYGNHGFRKIFDVAEEKISQAKNDSGNLLSIIDPNDKVLKVLIIDYDKMDKLGIREKDLRDEAKKRNFILIINRPNFEYFVLCHFIPSEEAAEVPMKDLLERINEEVKNYNEIHGYDKPEYSALKLPNYSKNRYESEDFFRMLLDQNPGIIDTLTKEKLCKSSEAYSEMWKLIDLLNFSHDNTKT